MTGFGKAAAELPNKKISVEIKSLNGKQLDLSTRVPTTYREKELEIRNKIVQIIERGKVDFYLTIEQTDATVSTKLNTGVIESYYRQIKETADKLNIDVPSDWFSVFVRLPEIVKTENVELDENEWMVVKDTIEEALTNLTAFRTQEGVMLENIFRLKIEQIYRLLSEVEIVHPERIEKIKIRITDGIKRLDCANYDENRLEQEMIYYIERLDVSEEIARLDNHLRYFLETMDTEKSPGRKLNFIAQEMGREINTLGSKSNHAEMQRIVVQMKDELEQIKEQILNVL
ncbi:hypothetical protein AGMMS50262_22250 [Bacteroidia bacterium]|nr:hypothetical protein AGMMS50262_22250 [Bacteroidia bacterium]